MTIAGGSTSPADFEYGATLMRTLWFIHGPATAEQFGWLGGFLAADCPTSSAITQQQLGWSPEHPGLIADLDAGHYFAG